MSTPPKVHEMWLLAVDVEFETLGTDERCQHGNSPKDHTPPARIVVKVKRESDGTVERFKAHIMAGVTTGFMVLNILKRVLWLYYSAFSHFPLSGSLPEHVSCSARR